MAIGDAVNVMLRLGGDFHDFVTGLWDDITGVSAIEDGIQDQRDAADDAQQELEPYTEAGEAAIGAYQDLLGLNGPEAQDAAVTRIQTDPTFQALVSQGEMGITQNASATGGLRGGNTQAALAQFGPAMLNQQIQQQLAHYQGLSGMGLNAAGGAADIHLGLGDAEAAASMASYQAQRQAVMDIANFAMNIAGMPGGFNPGTVPGAPSPTGYGPPGTGYGAGPGQTGFTF